MPDAKRAKHQQARRSNHLLERMDGNLVLGMDLQQQILTAIKQLVHRACFAK